MTKKMTRQEEHDFYAVPDNQTPQGPARRRNAKLTELVPVRFPPETLAKIRDAADAELYGSRVGPIAIGDRVGHFVTFLRW